MRQLWTPAWLVRHVGAVALVASFLALGWWQISRAAAGNTLSWAYAVEWPVFAAFVVFIWVREMRQALRESGRRASDAMTPTADDAAGGRPAPRPGIRRPVRVRSAVAAGRPIGEHGTELTEHGTELTEHDAELADYNRYLAWLNANPGARASDYPG